jgi:CO dehydrogenase nickel-insertion accessory protein CooC1
VCVWASGGILWSYGGVDGYTLGRIFCLCGRIIGVEGLEACQVFEPFLCSGGVLRFFVCEGGQVRLLVFGSVQEGEGSFCPCL